MELNCNVHASSFVKGGSEFSEYDGDGNFIDLHEPDEDEQYEDTGELKHALNLSGEYIFTYTYPLSVKANFPHTLTPEMTGEDLLVLAKADYERIYREEDEAVGNPGHIPGMLNRARSPGPYGIWGHDFSDLFFEGININEDTKAISFGMGS